MPIPLRCIERGRTLVRMAGPGQSLESERAGEEADRRIAELMAVINAATAELVSVVAALSLIHI